jgi:ferredoxin--NADP+ reductase
VTAVELSRNELALDGDGTPRARATAERETIPAGLVFRAIGYRGIPLAGVPFDERLGVIPNAGGRVVDPSTGDPLRGEYVVGWIKRGPSGVIGTNKKDAQQTVDAILADVSSAVNGDAPLLAPESPDAEAVERMLLARQPDLVPYEGWLSIDRHERALGEGSNRPRVKLTTIDEMLRIAASEGPPEDS